MHITRLTLKNWRNFTAADIPLTPRTFVIGNNGLGKSNLLDSLRFLHDIARESGGGLQNAVEKRDGLDRLRSLLAAKTAPVEIAIEARDGKKNAWGYTLALRTRTNGRRHPIIAREIVTQNGAPLLTRPDQADQQDPARLGQTALEQTCANHSFRPLTHFLQAIASLHMVPQLIRHAAALPAHPLPDAPYGQNLLNAMAQLPPKTRDLRLKIIARALQSFKPELSEFHFTRDSGTGAPHLCYRHKNWHPRDALHNEQQLSDGELRLIALLWALQSDHQLLLLEKPEFSLNEGIIRILPGLLANAVLRHKKRKMSQVILSTHSYELLNDQGIGPEELVVLSRNRNTHATEVASGKDIPNIVFQIAEGIPAADAALPLTHSSHQPISLDP